MKTYAIRLWIPLALGSLALGCSDAMQFKEQVTAAVDSNPTDTTLDPNKPQSTKTSGKTAPDSETSSSPKTAGTGTSEIPNTQGTGGTVYDGQDPQDPATYPADNASQSAQSAKQLFASCDSSTGGIVADVYELPAQTKALPDFNTLTALDQVCVEQLNISDRDFTEGFPGVPDLVEWFGLDMRFRIYAPQQGAYTFTLRSDDGSILTIDGKTVVNNDGTHSVTTKAGVIALSKGYHDVHLRYFQGPRYRIALELLWTVPGTSSVSYIPKANISRPQ